MSIIKEMQIDKEIIEHIRIEKEIKNALNKMGLAHYIEDGEFITAHPVKTWKSKLFGKKYLTFNTSYVFGFYDTTISLNVYNQEEYDMAKLVFVPIFEHIAGLIIEINKVFIGK